MLVHCAHARQHTRKRYSGARVEVQRCRCQTWLWHAAVAQGSAHGMQRAAEGAPQICCHSFTATHGVRGALLQLTVADDLAGAASRRHAGDCNWVASSTAKRHVCLPGPSASRTRTLTRTTRHAQSRERALCFVLAPRGDITRPPTSVTWPVIQPPHLRGRVGTLRDALAADVAAGRTSCRHAHTLLRTRVKQRVAQVPHGLADASLLEKALLRPQVEPLGRCAPTGAASCARLNRSRQASAVIPL